MWTNAFLLANAAGAGVMTLVIWYVQLWRYPRFAGVPAPNISRESLKHQRQITPVVMPAMLVEGVAAAALVIDPATRGPLAVAGAILIAMTTASTFFVQVPLHVRLARAGGDDEIRRLTRSLVRSNRIRTVAWSARFAIALAMLGSHMLTSDS